MIGSGDISPDGRILAAPQMGAIRLFDLERGKLLGTLVLLRAEQPAVWLAQTADGHYGGPNGIEREIVYVVQTAAGQDTLTPEEFSRRFPWKNDPERVQRTGN